MLELMMGRRAHIVLMALVLTWCCTLVAPPAHAQQSPWTGGGGIFVGLTLGKGKPSFEVGLEGFNTYRMRGLDPCADAQQSRYGVGSSLQVAYNLRRGFKIAAVGHAGGHFDATDIVALSGELGIVYNFKERALGARLGAVFQPHPWGDIIVRHELGLNDSFFGLGSRLTPTYGFPRACSV